MGQSPIERKYMKFLKPKIKKPKAPGKPRKIGNRTIIGIVCIIAAFAVCFGVAPLVNQVADEQVEIVRMRNTLLKGSCIGENDIEVVKVGAYNLPKEVIRDKSEVIGKYTTGDMYRGEYLLPERLTADVNTATDILGSLEGDKKAISISIGSFALGLSGKLETGDIISVIVYDAKEKTAFTPPELSYLRVITSTTSGGIDKADITDSSQPVTVTLLVNQKQAELLAQYEKTASMHFTLEYRGDAAIAQQYLDQQEQYFKGQTAGEG